MPEAFDYLQRRLEQQWQWHNAKAAWNKRWFYAIEIATLLAGAAIPVVSLLFANHPFRAGVLSAILGGSVVVAAALGKLFKFHENWLHYRASVETLGREKELYLNASAEYADADQARRNKLLVERVENILGATTSQFVAVHRTAREAESAEGTTSSAPLP
jgi:Protein of unknown function (DUF4231)